MGFMSRDELETLGFGYLGKNVLISKKASFYNPENISIGDESRIDDFCVISAGKGGITIGKYVHIAVYTSMIGMGKIEVGDFSTLSSRVSIYSSSDDYSGQAMVNPTLPDHVRNVDERDVTISEHVIVGAGSVILPGVTVGMGCAVGALSLIKKDCEALHIYAGNPLRMIGERKQNFLSMMPPGC